MEIVPHLINSARIAEVVATGKLINSLEDALGILGNIYYQGFDHIILHAENIAPDFFDLKNGLAGEILQKFSNYRIGLAIIGDFTHYNSKSLQDFIYESNKGKHICFVATASEAIHALTNK